MLEASGEYVQPLPFGMTSHEVATHSDDRGIVFELFDPRWNWHPDNDPSNPRMSPIHADLRGFPPLLVQVGEQEVFYGEATHLAANARKAGVDVSSEVFEGMWHFWHMNIHTLPEARNALAKVARFTEDCIANRSH